MSMMVSPYRFAAAGGGVPANITYGAAAFATGTSTGVQSCSITPLAGITPSAVIVVGSEHQIANDATETGSIAGLTFGALGTTQYSIACMARNFSTDTAVPAQGHFDSYVYCLLNTDAAATERATGSLVSGGFSLNYNLNDAANQRVVGLGFGGANVQSATGLVNLGTGTAAISKNVGFQPDAVIFYADGTNMNTSGIGYESSVTFGFLTAAAQSCLAFNCALAGPPSPRMAILSNRCAMEITTAGAKSYHITGALTATGFDVTPSASAGSDQLAYLALKFTGGGASLVPFTTPTATGNAAITGAGFKPRAAIVILSNLEATDPTFPVATADQMSGMSISLLSENEQWATSIRNRSGTVGYSTKSKNTALLGPGTGSAYAVEASLVSWDSDGMTLNYSTVQAAGKKGFILFFK